MKNESSSVGIAAILFAVLTFVGMVIANPPGGNYDEANIAKFVSHGHRGVVYVSLYLLLIAAVSLLYVVSGLRGRVGGRAGTLFTVAGYTAGAAWAIGAPLLFVVPIGLANGGATAPEPHTVYMFTQAGFGVIFGAGGVLLGVALVAFGAGVGAAVPAWVRWLTLVAGIVGLAAIAFFPFFALLIWALVVGIWLAVSGDRADTVPAAA